jgi:hypothetical protein
MVAAVAPILATDASSAPTLHAGLTYLNRGWSVIPICPGEKTPLIEWKPFQDRLASEDELMEWCDQWPTMNIAIVTGKLSGLAVIDIDEGKGGVESIRGAKIQLPPTRKVKTPHGWHFYYPYDDRLHTVAPVPGLPGVDIRAEGGYVLAPPSRLA